MTVAEQPRQAQRKPGPKRESRFAAVYTALTAWLSRPLADFHLVLALTGLLTSIGVVMVLSASSVASVDPEPGSGVYSLLKKHVVFVLTGAVIFWIGLRLPLRRVRALSWPAILVCLVMLMA